MVGAGQRSKPSFGGLVLRAFARWRKDAIPHHAAALAFYVLLALTPLAVVVLAGVGALYGFEEARTRIFEEVSLRFGREVGEFVRLVLAAVTRGSTGVWATILGLLVSILAGSNVFYQAKFSVDSIWFGAKRQTSAKVAIMNRLLAALMLVVLTTITVSWLVLIGMIRALSVWLEECIPQWLAHTRLLDSVVVWILIVLLFGALYAFLSPERVAIRYLLFPASLSSILVTLAHRVLLWYVDAIQLFSVYGVAGGPLVVMLWVFWSALAFFLGLEVLIVSMEDDRAGNRTLLTNG